MLTPDFKGQNVVVTGADFGLGRETAISFARFGANINVISRHEARLAVTALQVGGAGREVKIVNANLGDINEAQAAANELLELNGSIDVLVNIAAGWSTVGLGSRTLSEFPDLIMDTLTGATFLTESLLPGLTKSNKAHVINVASIDTRNVPAPRMYSTAYAKYGPVGFSESTRDKLEVAKVKLTTVYYGNFHADTKLDDHWTVIQEEHDEGYMGVRDIVESVLFCASRSPLAVIDTLTVSSLAG